MIEGECQEPDLATLEKWAEASAEELKALSEAWIEQEEERINAYRDKWNDWPLGGLVEVDDEGIDYLQTCAGAELVSPGGVVGLCRVTRADVEGLVEAGKVRAVRRANGQELVCLQDVREALAARRIH